MEKNRVLDPSGHPKTMSRPFNKTQRIVLLLFAAVCSLIVLSNCSLSKIAVPKDPLTPEEHLHLGLAYEKKGELEHAVKEYELAAQHLPIAYLYLGNLHFLKNDLRKAETYYKKTISKAPDQADAYNNLAWLYYTKRENLEQAESYALKAMKLNPLKDPIYRDTFEKIRELRIKEGETPTTK